MQGADAGAENEGQGRDSERPQRQAPGDIYVTTQERPLKGTSQVSQQWK